MASNKTKSRALRVASAVYGLFMRAFPQEFRVGMGGEVRRAFREGCRKALERKGLYGLLGYGLRGLMDATREGLAERKALRGRRRETGGGGLAQFVDSLRADLRFGARTLARRPVFTSVALVTLGVGIGSATAIFSVVNGVLLKPFPYPEADRLVVLWNTNPGRGQDEFRMAAPDVFEIESSAASFSGVALVAGATANLTGPDLPPVRVEGGLISAGFFRVLGVEPRLGRLFTEEENRGDHRVVLLSHALWAGRFGADPNIVGKPVSMDGLFYEVVGVMPPVSLPIGGSSLAFQGPGASVFWRPLDFELGWVSDIGAHVMASVARLRPGITLGQAQAELSALAAGMVAEGEAPEGQGILVRSFKEQVVGDVSRTLVILLASVVLLLLLACGNVANLLSARANDRDRELSVRAAIGAGRGRLVRQTLTETALLGLGGGLLGLTLAHWGSLALVSRLPASLPRQSQIGVDGSVLLFALAAVIVASVLAALIPTARLAGRDAMGGLKLGGKVGTRQRNRANRTIVVLQLSLATVLLFGAGLLFRSLRGLESVDPGFNKDGVLTAQLALPEDRYGTFGDVLSLYDQLRERIGALPGVEEVALGMDHPLQNTWWNGIGLLDRATQDPEETPTAIFRPVSDGYFSMLGIPVLEGRAFETSDRIDGHPVVAVNQAFVDKYYGGASALGDRIEFVVGPFIWGEATPTIFEVVAVVGDVRFNGLREPSEPAFYIPMHQFPYRAFKLLVRSAGSLESLAGLVQAEVWASDPDLPVTDLHTMEEIFEGVVAQDRFNVILLQVFGLVALVLAAAGIYGVLNYAVSQRRSEIGLRMALGAQASSVLKMVLWEAAFLGGLGLGLGIALSLSLSRYLGSLLFQVSGHHASVVMVTSGILGVLALGSGLIPASRAAGTDPMEALRAE